MSFTTLRLIAAAALVSFAAQSASALEQKTYDAAAFKAAQASGKPVLLHVTAPWCPTCKTQYSALESLSKNAAYKDVTVFKVDFDSQGTIYKPLKVTTQSTLIAYAGEKETGRLVGETGGKPIEALVKSAVK
jgi:thioredoxin 1